MEATPRLVFYQVTAGFTNYLRSYRAFGIMLDKYSDVFEDKLGTFPQGKTNALCKKEEGGGRTTETPV